MTTRATTPRAVVRGVGHYLPERIMHNAEFEATVDTTDEWIRSRSGIERRHIAAPGQTTSQMAALAAQAALTNAGLAGADIDAIILADRKSTRLNSSHRNTSRMPSSA